MDKIELFKSFVKTKPFLAYKVHSGLTTWQKLYEIYDVYGENHEIFSNGEKPKENSQNQTKTAETKTEKKVETNANTNSNGQAKASSSGKYKDGISSFLKTVQDIDVDKFMENVESFKKILAVFSTPSVKSSVNPTKTYKRFDD